MWVRETNLSACVCRGEFVRKFDFRTGIGGIFVYLEMSGLAGGAVEGVSGIRKSLDESLCDN